MSDSDIDSRNSSQFVKYNYVKTQLDRKSYIQTFVNHNRFPFRPAINMVLIILITFQVYLVVSSHMYLRGSLNRSFLQLYAQDDKYPQLYQGEAFYLTIKNISQVKQNMIYTFRQIQAVRKNSFLQMDLKNSKITLSIEYLNNLQSREHRKQFIIDPKVGIIQPFNMHKIEQIQKFLTEVNWFKLIVQNITVESEGFYEKYRHEVIYDYEQGLYIEVNFKFSIDNAMLNSMTIDKPQANYLLVIRGFYLIILILAAISIYLNYRYIRRTVKVIFQELDKKPINQNDIQHSLVNAQDLQQINEAVIKWIQVNKLTPQKLTFRHYFYIMQFDILFSIISNIFTIIGSFYLFIGMERQIIIGISCLTSWMTIFKFLRRQKKLVLMYELIKLSIVKVIFFFVQFFPVFLSYALLGLCLFPKVSFFSSLSRSVTTLVSLMLGDSISQISETMKEKNSTAMVVIYIFSFVFMFMHAIHNTLTALIKQAFIFKKIELIQQQKKTKQQKQYLYISELKCQADQEKDKLPIKISSSLQKDLVRINHLKKSKLIEKGIKMWVNEWQKVFFNEKWQTQQNKSVLVESKYLEELKRRYAKTIKILRELNKQGSGAFSKSKQKPAKSNFNNGESLLTNE